MKGLGPLGMHGRGARCYSDSQEKIFESMVTEFSGDHGAEQVRQQVGVQGIQSVCKLMVMRLHEIVSERSLWHGQALASVCGSDRQE